MKLNIPPLALCIVCGGLMYLISRYTWSYEGLNSVRLGVAVVVLLLSFAFLAFGVSLFNRKKTTVNPLSPEEATYLVTSGVYAITRNPMYLGFMLALASFCIYLGNIASLSFVIGFAVYMNCIQIPSEERALSGLFGEQFDQYKSRVRRWL